MIPNLMRGGKADIKSRETWAAIAESYSIRVSYRREIFGSCVRMFPGLVARLFSYKAAQGLTKSA